MTVQQYQQEQAERAVQERWDTVMKNFAAHGREPLAKSLLAVTGSHRLTTQQIITAFGKSSKARRSRKSGTGTTGARSDACRL